MPLRFDPFPPPPSPNAPRPPSDHDLLLALLAYLRALSSRLNQLLVELERERK